MLNYSQYLLKEIQREELYKYATDMIHKMLQGDILYLKNLEIWGILTKIAEIDDADDLYCESETKQCYEILTGMQNGTFAFAMHFPSNMIGDSFSGLEEILVKYNKERIFSKDGIEKLNTITQKQVHAISTVNEFLEAQIIDLLKLGYMFIDAESSYCLKSSVFVSDKEAERLLNKIIALLGCYSGKNPFFVQIVYKEGKGNISLLV